MKLTKYRANPIFVPEKNNPWEAMCVLNPAVVYVEEKKEFVMLYRAAGFDNAHRIVLGLATSKDGIHFTRCFKEPVYDLHTDEPDGGSIEDPRLIQMGNAYYLVYAARPWFCGRYWLPPEERWEGGTRYKDPQEDAPLYLRKNYSVSYLAYSEDLIHWKRLGRLSDPRFDDRDNVIFPEKIKGKYWKLSRPYRPDTPQGYDHPGIWIASGDDMIVYEEPKLLYPSGLNDWQDNRVGVGCPPMKTKDGWLILFHGVSQKDSLYRIGFMLLDLEDPTKILSISKEAVMEPDQEFEKSPFYPGCVFPTGWVNRDGLLYIYYGCGDQYISLATVKLDDVLNALKQE